MIYEARCCLPPCLALQEELRGGEDIARCPSCSLYITVIYDPVSSQNHQHGLAKLTRVQLLRALYSCASLAVSWIFRCCCCAGRLRGCRASIATQAGRGASTPTKCRSTCDKGRGGVIVLSHACLSCRRPAWESSAEPMRMCAAGGQERTYGWSNTFINL